MMMMIMMMMVIQVVSRARQRAVKLQDSLRLVRQNAAHVDELTDWLSDCHTLLTAKDKDSIPEDLTVVNALLNEHAVRYARSADYTACVVMYIMMSTR